MSKEVFSFNSSQVIDKSWGYNYVKFNPQGHVYVFLDKEISETIPTGWETQIFRKGGDGNVRFTVDNGVYLDCMITRPQTEKDKSTVTLRKTGEYEFHLSGDIKSY